MAPVRLVHAGYHRPRRPPRHSHEDNAEIVLCEIHKMSLNQLSYVHFAAAGRESWGPVEFIGYSSRGINRIGQRAKELRFIRLWEAGPAVVNWFYHALGVRKVFVANDYGEAGLAAGKEQSLDFYMRPSLEALENLQVEGIHIGDLVYDEFLTTRRVATIDLESRDFQNFLLDSIAMVHNWLEFFDSHSVRAVIASHVYLQVVPLRIAASRGIGAYVVDHRPAHTYSLSRDFPRAREHRREYPKIFSDFSIDRQAVARAQAQKLLEVRLSGFRFNGDGADHRTPKRATSATGSKVKILVAPHEFTDSPHNFMNFYPDHYQWLRRLGHLAKTKNWEWYIKAHPQSSSLTLQVLEDFVADFPSFTLVPQGTTHRTLLQEHKITAAVTVVGTIGSEYPYLGIPVVHASANHPHSEYRFAVTPSSREDYEDHISRLDALESQIDREELLEYWFMNALYNRDFFFPWPFLPQRRLMLLLRHRRFKKSAESRALISSFTKFIESGDYWFDNQKHRVRP